MATLAVVKDLEILKHRVSQLNASAPSSSVEQLDLHPTPKRLHHGVVEAVAYRAPRATPTAGGRERCTNRAVCGR